MSRHGYIEGDCYDDYDMLRMEGYRQAVRNAINGKRGQKFLRELGEALDAMPEKKLCAFDLQRHDGMVCALGAVGAARGVDMTKMDPEAHKALGKMFDIAPSLVREIEYENDDDLYGMNWYADCEPWDTEKSYEENYHRPHRKNEAGEEINKHGFTKEQWEQTQDTRRWSRVRQWVRERIKT